MAQKLYRGKKERENFKILKEEMAKRAEIERASRERAKAKQQREEQERTSRAVAGVNHLEIPAELAFIYSKLDGKIFIILFIFYFLIKICACTVKKDSSQCKKASVNNSSVEFLTLLRVNSTHCYYLV